MYLFTFIIVIIINTAVGNTAAISFSRGSSQPRDQTQVSCIAGRFFTIWATREALLIYYQSLNMYWAPTV